MRNALTLLRNICWSEKFISSLKHVVRKLELSLTEMQGDTKNTVQKWKYVLHLSMQTAYLRKQRTNLIVLKKRDLGFCFLSCKTKFQLTVNVQLAWRSPAKSCLFEKIRFQNDLIFLNFLDTEGLEPFKEVGIEELRSFKRTSASQFFNGSRI